MTLILVLLLALWPAVASAQYVTGAPSAVGGGIPVGGSCATANALARYTAATTLGCSTVVDVSGALSGITTASMSGQLTSTLVTGTAPFVVASTTVVANLNASALGGATFAAPGAIGGGTPSTGAFTTTTATTSATIGGATPTAITNIRVYAASLTPAQLAAAVGATEEAFTVTGLTTADKVFVNGPAPTALCPPVGYRVSAADTLAITFVDLTIALCTPAAGTYNIVAIRS